MSEPGTPLELLKQARVHNLLKEWTKAKRLVPAEVAEIREVFPDFEPGPTEAAAPGTSGGRKKGEPQNATSPGIPGDVAAPAGFTLVPGAPLPAKLRGFYKLAYRDYAPVYQLSAKHGERTIKRWVSIGRHAAPPEPPPLDTPPGMAAWWRRHSTERPPQVLLDYENNAPTPSATVHEAPPASGAAPASAPAATGAATASDPILLSGIDLGSSVSVQRAAAIEDAYHKLLKDALADGKLDEAKKWRAEFESAAELTNKLRRQDREERKASGDLISRGPVIAELAQLLEALRLMREAMPQKILAELSKRASGRLRRVLKLIEPSLVESILAVRGREADILTTIELLRSPADARTAFALEAA